MKYTIVILIFFFCVTLRPVSAQTVKALFDNTKSETAGNADWIIDTDQPVPVPAQSGITSGTAESYWLGAISAWGVDLVKRGFTVHTLTSAYGITYGNPSNPYDLSNYNLFIVCEPQGPFSTAEKSAIKTFVQNGGGLMMVADHNASDRNSDGWDSPMVWNDLRTDSLFGIHFQSAGESNNNITQVSTNVAAGTDPILSGGAGTATALSYHNGTTMNLLPSVNPNAAGHFWMNGVVRGNTQVMMATSRYGLGKVAGVGDSSPADDGTAQPGNSNIYDGWMETGATDNIVFLNACLWLVAKDPPAQVVLVSPSDLALDVPLTASLQWHSVGSSTAYQLDVSLSSAFTSSVYTDSTITDTFRVPTGLSNNTAYYWRVRAGNQAGWGTYSTARQFTTWAGSHTITADNGPNGTISPAGAITVAHLADQAFTITPSTGYHIDSVIVDGVYQGAFPTYTFSSVTADHTIHAVFAINRYQISATAGLYGTINPSGIITADYGSDVQFTYYPQPGYMVDGVTVDGLRKDSLARYTFRNIDSNHSIDVQFRKVEYSLTSSVDGNGIISINPNQALYDSGATVEVTAVPGTGWHFVNWSGIYPDTANPVSLTLDSNRSIVAHFAINTYTVTLSSTGGTIIPEPDLPMYPYGSAVILTPVPDAGQLFIAWSGDSTGNHEADSTLTVVIRGNLNITALFSSHAFGLKTSALHGEILRVPNQAAYDSGSTVVLNAVPTSGYSFTGWNGDVTGSLNPVSFAMNRSMNVNANFTRNQYIITASSGLHGIVTPSGAVPVFSGDTVRFTFQPDVNYAVDSVFIDGIGRTDSTEGFSFANIGSDHLLHVSFRLITVPATAYISRGWNMVSLPVHLPDQRSQIVYPDVRSRTFRYQGQYLAVDTLDAGVGYWLKFSGDTDIVYNGQPVSVESVAVSQGWNMIGSITVPVVPGTVMSEPPGIVTSQFFGYAGKYLVADTLHPGSGYWIKCSEAGKLFIASPVGMRQTMTGRGPIRIVPATDQPPVPPGETRLASVSYPVETRLLPAYPNPFNPVVRISFDLAVDPNTAVNGGTMVTITIHDILGKKVETLVHERREAGEYTVEWNGSGYPSGVYFYTIVAGERESGSGIYSRTGKLILIR